MLISKEKLKEVVKTTLQVIEPINSLGDLEKLLGEVLIPDLSKRREIIEISKKPSKQETSVVDISYFLKGRRDIPLKIKINPQLDRSEIVVKFNGSLEEYTPIIENDTYGNRMQEIELPTTDFQEVRRELKKLY